MKRKLCLAIMVMALFGMAGCGKQTDASTVESGASEEASESELKTETTDVADAETDGEIKDISFEIVKQGGEVFLDRLGQPTVSCYYVIKNTGNTSIFFPSARIEYVDNSGKLLATDSYPQCIPQAIKPGQIGYIYSYYFDISSIDLSNGFNVQAAGNPAEAAKFYELEVSDVSFRTGSGAMDVTVSARGTNNTASDVSFAEPGAVLFDKNDNVVGFCYDLVSFGAGQSVGFELAGDLLSSDYDISMVDHAEVYIQGNTW